MLTMHADVCSHPTTLQSIIVALQTAVDSRNCLGDVKKGEKKFLHQNTVHTQNLIDRFLSKQSKKHVTKISPQLIRYHAHRQMGMATNNPRQKNIASVAEVTISN